MSAAIPGRRTNFLYPLGTDTGPAGTPSRRRRNPSPRAATDEPPRWDGAACEGWATELWFSDRADDTELARSICDECPHTGRDGACATFARTATNPRILHGIWGGLDMGNRGNRIRKRAVG